MKEDLKNDDVRGERLAPAVFALLEGHGFFEQLEALVYPLGADGPQACDRSFRHAQSLFDTYGFTAEDRADVITVMRSRGGFCDCEILLNADERHDSPKSRCWAQTPGDEASQ